MRKILINTTHSIPLTLLYGQKVTLETISHPILKSINLRKIANCFCFSLSFGPRISEPAVAVYIEKLCVGEAIKVNDSRMKWCGRALLYTSAKMFMRGRSAIFKNRKSNSLKLVTLDIRMLSIKKREEMKKINNNLNKSKNNNNNNNRGSHIKAHSTMNKQSTEIVYLKSYVQQGIGIKTKHGRMVERTSYHKGKFNYVLISLPKI
jgi:hypothetical protein